MILIQYHHFDNLPEPEYFQQMLSRLPARLHRDITKYHRLVDQYTHLLGKLMLAEQLDFFGLGRDRVGELLATDYGKPYLDGITFNISHSHHLVICASSVEINWLGVDTEHIRDLDIEFAKGCFSPEEWAQIKSEELNFFDGWAQKEAFMKADGRGMSLPPVQISLEKSLAKSQDGKVGFLKQLDFHEEYACWLCTDAENIELHKSEFVMP